MPRKTRILDADDEYLFVEAPGDALGPALLIFAHPENARAVPSRRSATHRSEHGQWVQIARIEDDRLEITPDAPAGLEPRLERMLPRYAEVRRQELERARNPCFWIEAQRRGVHGLHPAQPGGLLLKLWRSEPAARSALASGAAAGVVRSTGDLREFLELRAEEGFAGALLDDQEIVFFCLDPGRRMQFLKLSAGDAADGVHSHLLGEAGRWQLWEGDEALEPFADPDAWDQLMVRAYGRTPFFGYGDGWRCFVLERDGEPVAERDLEGDGEARMVALFHDPAAADAHRTRREIGRARLRQVEEPIALLRDLAARGLVARLHPGDHRVRGGTLWLDGDDAVLYSFSGLWRSKDGRRFEPAE